VIAKQNNMLINGRKTYHDPVGLRLNMSCLCISVLSGSPSIRPWVSSPREVFVGTCRQVLTKES
jgi:hypothetical protein